MVSFVMMSAMLACPPADPAAHDGWCGTKPVPIVDADHGVKCGAQVAQQIDLALCLDTSGSMQGLIDAARCKLWDIVNDLAQAKPTPRLRVALLTYGNSSHCPENGWVNVDCPFTTDLDLVSAKLFALTTNGGDELVGRVVHAAAHQLTWTVGDDALKLIVVAGNESADQDRLMSYRQVCRSAARQGILIDAIYCGDVRDGIAPEWRQVAAHGQGHFAAIDHVRGTVIVSTPFDDDLAKLSEAINDTYVPYGAHGTAGAMNQRAQDANTAALGAGAAASRCATKAGAMYRNAGWDLVDATRDQSFDLTQVAEEQLSEAMREKTLEQRRQHVEAMARSRAELQERIAQLNAQRQAFIQQETAKQADSAEKSFDAALINAVRSQAECKGFRWNTES